MSGQYLYVHVPFCEQKCPYCDFYSVARGGAAQELAGQWLRLVAREAQLWAEAGELSRETPIETLFFGGGTPSLIPAEALAEFLGRLRAEFVFAPNAEITIEMQPGTADAKKLEAYARGGINRFSIGVQSFNPVLLERIGRRHTVEESRALLAAARGLGQVSLDLISALPGQSLEEWRRELDEALSWNVCHISVYELTFHPGTEFTRRLQSGQIEQSDEELRVELFETTRKTLCAAGYEHYEISNYARPGARSRHNENYWKLGNYVGLGAGAHSFIFPHRYVNDNSVERYRAAIESGRLFRRTSDTADRTLFLLENLQMPLRLSEGVDLDWFAARYGWDLRLERGEQLRTLREAGLVELHGARLCLSDAGRLQFDSVLEYLL